MLRMLSRSNKSTKPPTISFPLRPTPPRLDSLQLHFGEDFDDDGAWERENARLVPEYNIANPVQPSIQRPISGANGLTKTSKLALFVACIVFFGAIITIPVVYTYVVAPRNASPSKSQALISPLAPSNGKSLSSARNSKDRAITKSAAASEIITKTSSILTDRTGTIKPKSRMNTLTTSSWSVADDIFKRSHDFTVKEEPIYSTALCAEANTSTVIVKITTTITGTTTSSDRSLWTDVSYSPSPTRASRGQIHGTSGRNYVTPQSSQISNAAARCAGAPFSWMNTRGWFHGR